MPEKQKNTILKEILFLGFLIFFVRFWTSNPLLSPYNLQLTGFLAVIYFCLRFFFSKNDNSSYKILLLDTLIFTGLLLLIINFTGELNSSLFFLIYLYLFVFSLLFEQTVTIFITLFLIIFFSKDLNSVGAILQVVSLLLFSPLAIFFGRQYLKVLESQEKIKILHKESKKLSADNQQQTKKIATSETNALLWLSLEFKDSLLKIIHYSADLLTDIGHLSISQKENLEKIHSSAKNILKSGEKLQEKIDKETD